MTELTLVSHHLCPYVQRAAISLDEKQAVFERKYVDLQYQPSWFAELSPLGKVPLLVIENRSSRYVIFESAVILEYLEETLPKPMHPVDPLERARHRSWMEYGSAILDCIARLYGSRTDDELSDSANRLSTMFARVEGELMESPWFAGGRFSLVDVVFGPIFRYFDAFERHAELHLLTGLPKVELWRRALADRASIRNAVAPDYADRLCAFLRDRRSAVSARMLGHSAF